MRVIEHESCYEFCEWEGGINKVYDAMAKYKDKPIMFSLEAENIEATKFYRRLLELGKIRMKNIIFEVVK